MMSYSGFKTSHAKSLLLFHDGETQFIMIISNPI